MRRQSPMYSVSKVAEMCGVNRNTVGLWIRSKKLRAEKNGRNYAVPADELVFFLKRTRRAIPDELKPSHPGDPFFRTIQTCWQYFQEKFYENGCSDCPVFTKQMEVCFTVKESTRLQCSGNCYECQYFIETFYPRMKFIHQLKIPAAIYKNYALWGGNRAWAGLCGVDENQLIGKGIENVFVPDSLQLLMAHNKRRSLDDPGVPYVEKVRFQGQPQDMPAIDMHFYAMREPEDAWLMMATP